MGTSDTYGTIPELSGIHNLSSHLDTLYHRSFSNRSTDESSFSARNLRTSKRDAAKDLVALTIDASLRLAEWAGQDGDVRSTAYELEKHLR